jgi:hypothetical protein
MNKRIWDCVLLSRSSISNPKIILQRNHLNSPIVNPPDREQTNSPRVNQAFNQVTQHQLRKKLQCDSEIKLTNNDRLAEPNGPAHDRVWLIFFTSVADQYIDGCRYTKTRITSL